MTEKIKNIIDFLSETHHLTEEEYLFLIKNRNEETVSYLRQKADEVRFVFSFHIVVRPVPWYHNSSCVVASDAAHVDIQCFLLGDCRCCFYRSRGGSHNTWRESIERDSQLPKQWPCR